MKTTFLSICFALLSTSPIYVHAVSPVGLSSWDEVVSAVAVANQDGAGTIRLASRATIHVDRPLPAVTANIAIEGNGATLQPANDFDDSILLVSHTGHVQIEDLYITGFSSRATGFPSSDAGLIDNEGYLALNRVSFSGNSRCSNCDHTKFLVNSRATASLNNVTVVENQAEDSSFIANHGTMRIVNSTFADNESWVYWCGAFPIPLCGWSVSYISIGAYPDSITEIGNALLMGQEWQCWSRGEIIDLGGNYFEENECELDTDINAVGQPANLGSFGYHGGLIPTLGLEPNSAAIDAGNNDICSATDARFANRPVSGSIHSEPKCDAGAFEYGGAFGNSDLAVNGMNGLWFSQASDGHYVHLWRVSPDRVYINWTAFDQSANQMWIFAVADTVGESKFSATAYINEGGQLIPGGAPQGSHVSEWGSIEVEFESCTVGTFRYDALDEGIGSGEFQIDRLAFIEGGGCSD